MNMIHLNESNSNPLIRISANSLIRSLPNSLIKSLSVNSLLNGNYSA
jgi:hypothetical protein